MHHLKPAQIEELKQLLQQKLERLSDYQESVEQSSPINAPDRVVSNESGEDALEEYDILASEALESETGAMLHEIKSALARIEAGNYGIDEHTSQPIPYERLRLFPEARSVVPKQ